MTDIHPKQLENVIDNIGPILEGICDGVDSKTLENVAEAAIRAAARPLPIEDAPKDGTNIIIVKNKSVYAPCQYQKEDVISKDSFWLWWQNEPEHLTEVIDPDGFIPIPTQESE